MFSWRSIDIADGSRLLDRDNDRLWFIFEQKRHHVVCSQVHGSLFVREVALLPTTASVLGEIPEGQELLFGTSLVRRGDSISVYFLAAHPKANILHYVPSKDIADRCGFDLSLSRTLPASTFDKLKIGADLR